MKVMYVFSSCNYPYYKDIEKGELFYSGSGHYPQARPTPTAEEG